MSFGQFQQSDSAASRSQGAMADINVTPMVDVMLVLLVIFIIAAPFMTHAIKLDLPQAQSAAVPEPASTIPIAFDAAGRLYWDKDLLSMAELEPRLAILARSNPQAEIQLRADKATRYEIIAQVMAAAQAQGLSRISFITDKKAAR
ncbi:ExbD/TolR family protein [Undibacterium sp. Di26W]|uniref:ExbD/TolR family protein n=1 Tax=Undibacterium sp. Di26W TaxID=3413035 RepID=UPI003BF2FE5C